MCARPMLAAPLHDHMPPSAAPLSSHGQPFTQHWDILNSYAPSHGHISNVMGGGPSRTLRHGLDSYVDKWLAETGSQTRARSVPVSTRKLDKHLSAITHTQIQRDYHQGTTATLPPALPTIPNPLLDRSHCSLSPDSKVKPTCPSRHDTMNGIDGSQIATALQIPDTVNDSRGSLAEFAAQITCLFWFEDASTLARIEGSTGVPATVPLPMEANPTVGFRKWVTTLLSTTQVSQNVILLALLFVYRLKNITANVKGKAGSEYRLLTVALMLGNKFLDDNTYTNKTWADVSGISVSEIHVMEVEFLSNMKYDLYTSAEHWHQWQRLLGKFAEYFDKASRAYNAVPTPSSMATSHLAGPQAASFTPPSEQLSPPHLAAQRAVLPQRQLPNPLPVYNTAMSLSQPATRIAEELRTTDLKAAGSRPASRKRSFDEPMFSLPQKQARTNPSSSIDGSGFAHLPMIPSHDNNLPRLPVPSSGFYSATTTAPLYAPSYPTTVPPPVSQLTLPAPVMFSTEQSWQPHSTTPSSNFSSGVPSLPSLLTQTTLPTQQPDSQNASPTNTSFPPPQVAHSPSGYLMYRNSPYRPVRQVNTLLAPPPSMVALQSPSQHMSQQPTYYQPLSKGPIEPRQGMVPYLTPRQFQMAPMDPSRQMPPLDYRQYLGHR